MRISLPLEGKVARQAPNEVQNANNEKSYKFCFDIGHDIYHGNRRHRSDLCGKRQY